MYVRMGMQEHGGASIILRDKNKPSLGTLHTTNSMHAEDMSGYTSSTPSMATEKTTQTYAGLTDDKLKAVTAGSDVRIVN